ncbi:glycosyltransferase family 2 protein [Pontibacter kalidii]|uniref:glycosyltransferase family 2 protein n=1 Tax=Pontibacter kalidii TaxID=2592049 RepID=UPI002250F013|nr:glycosyltransferase family 2 protein [Pontibacter kalidii]
MIDVSIIILNYNTFQLTCGCIESIYEKTQHVTFEIILVDNASSECPAEAFKDKFSEIVLLKSSVNLGFSKGVNFGLREAKGKAVLLLNSDTRLINNAVYLAYKRLFSENTLAAVSCKVVTSRGEVQSVAQRFPSIKLLVAELLRLYRIMTPAARESIFLGDYFNHDKEVYADWVWATFFMIKKSVIKKLPGQQLDDTFFMYEEDKLWCYQFADLEYKILYTPAPEIIHYVSGSTKSPQEVTLRNKRIIQNEFTCLSMMRSKPYAKLYFILKSLQYRFSGYTKGWELALLYQKVALGREI